jgi:hypothetical protein
MKKNHVIFDFIKLPIPGKVVRGRKVITDMTGNPSFVTPDVPLDVLKTATDLLESRYLAAKKGGKENTALMHQAEEAWDELMRKEAMYVERIANSDDAMILSAGFSLSKQPAPAQRPEFSAVPGENMGSVILRRKAVQGAYAYVWQYCINLLPETEDGWTHASVSGKASVELTGLTSVTKYWFRVAAVMADGPAPYCDPVMMVVT